MKAKIEKFSSNWAHDHGNPERRKAQRLLSQLKQREHGGTVVFESDKMKITTYGRESRTLNHLIEKDIFNQLSKNIKP